MRNCYAVGGLTFSVEGPDYEENDVLRKFRCESEEADIETSVVPVERVELPEGKILYEDSLRRYYRTKEGIVRVFVDELDNGVLLADYARGDRHEVHFREEREQYFGSNLALKIMDMPHRVIAHGGVFLHASFIEYNGEAILFTAAKQVGKSTQASLWEKTRGTKIVNGDRALLRRKDGTWYAWGSPYAGTSKITENRALPVRTVVILSQDKESRAKKTDVRRAFSAMLDGTTFDTWNKEEVTGVSNICGEIITDVRFCELACRPDESAVRALEEIL